MADFSIRKILNKISKYDKLTMEIPNIDTLLEYKLINNYLNQESDKTKEYTNATQENIIATCSEIKTLISKVLK